MANNLSGQVIAGYELREILGTGATTTVYRAFQTMMGRYVALKLLSAQLASDPDFAERLESGKCASLPVSNTRMLFRPTIVGVHGEHIFIVTRLLTGGTLGKRLATGSLPLSDVKRILVQIASALDYAHHLGVIHQDIKPDNILLDDAGNAYLSNFSMARLTKPDALTASGALTGTPAYLSPEQAQGIEAVAASDQYSLAVVAFQMLTARLPFIGETPMQVLLKIIQESPPPLSSFRADLPTALDPVFKRAFAKKPEERYAVVSEFAWDFGEGVRRYGSRAIANFPTDAARRHACFRQLQQAEPHTG